MPITLQWNDTAFRARLNGYVQRYPAQAEQIVFKVAAEVLADAKVGWPVDSGASRAGWIGPRRIDTLTYQLSNPFRYARVIEYGGYRGLGPKTVEAGGETLPGSITVNRGIYPRQRPAAPLRRALSKAYGRMTKALGEAL